MPKKIDSKIIASIEDDLKESLDYYYIANKYKVSTTTVMRVKTKEYYMKKSWPKHGHKNPHPGRKQPCKIPLDIDAYFKKKNAMKTILKRLVNSNTIIVLTDNYNNKFKKYHIKFLYRNEDLFFFKDLVNQRTLCFKFGDFISSSVKIVEVLS